MDWKNYIDERYSTERSLLLRYHKIFNTLDLGAKLDLESLEKISLGEGARSFHLKTYKGVDIIVSDESSLMKTGTYKALDACLSTVLVRAAGQDSLVLSSAANLGRATCLYAGSNDVQVYFFFPSSTMFKIESTLTDSDNVHCISVDLHEKSVKALAMDFADQYGIKHVPDVQWRYAASAARAMFVLETMNKMKIDYLAQVMCAGFGPVGIYQCFGELIKQGLVNHDEIPSFIGFQQEANAPMVRAWQDGKDEIGNHHVGADESKYLEPILYNTNPGANYTKLFDVLKDYGGDLMSISQENFDTHFETLVEWFDDVGFDFARDPETGKILEKTGLLTGLGILKAIDEGRIKPGERVMYLLTGGYREEQKTQHSPIVPDMSIDGSRPMEAWVKDIAINYGLDEPSKKVV